ncbi:STAS domain-containing protein [Micromonospora orduensis]|jgi:anti-anti-sigma factor|uniref:Anti-sigma factor antagonist n=1 Tax=Micromonospora orduensis TaxID=1420891 RepID=A0A5C4QTL5_9ACTN|nr:MULTISPECIES: STAS domain-containing protein [Micromonospora]MBQ0994709.1 STAS domain-containing protein [Micromonospora sp. H61]TNH29176.1 STAS domain-containing protein [Micromonospora orduensis]
MRFSLTRHHRDDGLVTLALAGDVDMGAVDALVSALQDTLQTPDRIAVVVDLARVTFLDCAGIGALVVGRNTAVSRGHRYTVVNPQRQVRRVLELTGVFTALTGRHPQPAPETARAARSRRSRRHRDDRRCAAKPSTAGVDALPHG